MILAAHVGGALFAAAAACGPATPSATPPSAPAPTAIVVADAPPPPRNAATRVDPAKSLAAWTDPGGVDRLVADCSAKVDTVPEGAPDPLSCHLPFQQSCVYDPCFEKGEKCREACSAKCGTCEDGCATTCGSCKSACKDDACRRACATTTGACKQACIQTVDHCSSGECSARETSCDTEERKAWTSHHCSCTRIRPCTADCVDAKATCLEKCAGKDAATCAPACEKSGEACLAKCRGQWPGCNLAYCILSDWPPWEGPPKP